MKMILIVLLPFIIFAQKYSEYGNYTNYISISNPPMKQLTAWWRISDNLLLDGNNVDTWTDKINSIILSDNTPSAIPTYQENQIAGKGAINFDALGEYLITSDNNYLRADGDFTIIAFVKRNTSSSAVNEPIILKKDTIGVVDSYIEYGYGLKFTAPSNVIIAWYYQGASQPKTTDYLMNDTDWHLIEWSAGANGDYLYVDGVLEFNEETARTPSYRSGAEFILSGHWNGGGTLDGYFNGKIVEVLFYQKQLSTSERARLIKYINRRYGQNY